MENLCYPSETHWVSNEDKDQEIYVEPQSLASALSEILKNFNHNLLRDFFTPTDYYQRVNNREMLIIEIQTLLERVGLISDVSKMEPSDDSRRLLFSERELRRMYFKGVLASRNGFNKEKLERVDQIAKEQFIKGDDSQDRLITRLIDSIPLKSEILDLEALEQNEREIRKYNEDLRRQKQTNRDLRIKKKQQRTIDTEKQKQAQELLEKEALEKKQEELRLYEIRLNKQESEYLKKLKKKK